MIELASESKRTRAILEDLETAPANLLALSDKIRLSIDHDDPESNQQGVQLKRELNRDKPHSIDEGFTFQRPCGFILAGQGASGITIWPRLYDNLCRILLRRDRERLHALVDPGFISNPGHHLFYRDRDHLRWGGLIGDGIYAEVSLSANSLRDSIRKLLATFRIPEKELKLFLREDRDAELPNRED